MRGLNEASMCEILAERKVQNQVTGEIQRVDIRLLNPDELDIFEQLHLELVREFGNTGVLNANSRTFSANCILQESGFCLGGFLGRELVSYVMIYYPGENASNLGLEVGLSQNKLLKVAHVDQTGVKPEYRKNNLTLFTRRLVTDILVKKGMDQIFSTISPQNIASLRNATQCHYAIVKLKEKYGGKLRFIMQYLPDIKVDAEQRDIIHTDYSEQLELLQKGWIGRGISKEGYVSYFLKQEV